MMIFNGCFFLFPLLFTSEYAAQHHALNLFQNWDIESLESGNRGGIMGFIVV